MKTPLLFALLTICSLEFCSSQNMSGPIRIADNLEAIQISEHAFVHVSYADIPPWGRVASNGLVFLSDGEALLFDTPTSDSLTKTLVQWITNSLKARVVGFVPNHWHDDCMGGLGYLHSIGIPSYAQEKTIAIAESKKLPVPQHSFADSLTLRVGKEIAVCRYFGAAHTVDNIVVWIPSKRVLFGGCMVKELTSKTLGNTADADLLAWPSTISLVLAAFPDARVVIPGHGAMGGTDLLLHTEALLKNSR